MQRASGEADFIWSLCMRQKLKQSKGRAISGGITDDGVRTAGRQISAAGSW